MQLKLAKKKEINEDVLRMIIQYGLGFASRVKNLEDKCIEEWEADKLYTKEESFVIYDNYLWQAKVTNQSSVWNESYWEKIGDELSLITKSDIESMVNLSSEELVTLQNILLDSSIELSHTWSSSKIYGEIQNAIKKGEAFTLSKLASTMTASFEIATSTSDITEGNILYLLSTGTNTYDIYALIDGTPTDIGSTKIDLSNYYTKTEIDNDFVKKADADGKYATITTVNGKVDKTSILSAISSTPSNDKLLSEKAINDTLVKKTDIKTTLDENSTNTDVCSGKAIFDVIKAISSPGASYSTDEQLTGGTWIDGRPIYQKVITGNFESNVRISISLNETCDIGWIDLGNTYITGSFGVRQPWCVNNDEYKVSTMYFSEGVFNFNTSHPDGTIYVTISYVK